jgi:hypothetical protein
MFGFDDPFGFGGGGDSSGSSSSGGGGMFGGGSNPLSSIMGGGGLGGMMGGIGGMGSLFGGLGDILGGDAVWGKKPVVPDYPDIMQSQVNATMANIGNFGNASALASSTNRFNQDQILQMLREAVPGYDTMTGQASKDINSQLRGEVPKDVQEFITNTAASRALAGGFSQSGLARNMEARDLGLTSLNIMNRGLDSASRWIAQQKQAATPEMFGVQNMFISPAQKFASDESKFGRDWLASTVEAAPDPAARGGFNTAMQALGMILGIYSGGPGYKDPGDQKWGGVSRASGGQSSTNFEPNYNSNQTGGWEDSQPKGGGGEGALAFV